MRLSPKQKRYWNEANCRWNVKYGATRSGKTYLDYFIIPRRLLAREGRPGLAVLLGNTRGTLERNVLAPMREIYGAQMVSPLRADGTATLFGQRVHCLGADNKRHVDRLRGASIKYCYGDEVVSWEREVFEMLKSRLDKEYSCFDGTCNPAGPGHWFKKFLDSGADIFSQQYGIDDNPFLPESVRAALKREYTGVFYQRYILGQWVAAEGAVYPMFERGRHVSDAAPIRALPGWAWTTATPTPRPLCGWALARTGACGRWRNTTTHPARRGQGRRASTPPTSSASRAAAPAWSSTPRRRASSCSCTRTAPPCASKRPTTPCWRACSWFRRRWTRGN